MDIGRKIGRENKARRETDARCIEQIETAVAEIIEGVETAEFEALAFCREIYLSEMPTSATKLRSASPTYPDVQNAVSGTTDL